MSTRGVRQVTLPGFASRRVREEKTASRKSLTQNGTFEKLSRPESLEILDSLLCDWDLSEEELRKFPFICALCFHGNNKVTFRSGHVLFVSPLLQFLSPNTLTTSKVSVV